jgi:hypothetical protein
MFETGRAQYVRYYNCSNNQWVLVFNGLQAYDNGTPWIYNVDLGRY